MVFSSSVFLLMFLPIVFVGNALLKKEHSNIFLLLASLVFYAWGEPYLVLLMLASVVFNWGIGLFLSRTKGRHRKLFLTIGIICNLGILGCFKYAGFFANTLNSLIGIHFFPVLEIALPLGISFFTFQAISYIVDVYRGDTDTCTNFVNLALYISFFPQLIAGPIVKYKDINNQIESRTVCWLDVSDGFKRFIYGLGKKVLIANVLGLCVDTIHTFDITEVDFRMAWIGAIAYSFQIYYDFSGYSDMAIGLGRMFGFRILENFDYPYLSHSISEFWRRWHVSLGAWFKEYVYIPLGGNRKGEFRTYVNLIIVFSLTGLWHGAALSFVIWGLFHCFFTIIERLWLKKVLGKSQILSVFYTFFIVNLGWVMFRAESTLTGIKLIERMLFPWNYPYVWIKMWEYMDNKTIFIFACAVTGMGLLKLFVPFRIKSAWENSVVEALYCVGILVLCLAAIASDTYNPFIYFRF